jgi:hypothetical protein
MLSEAQDSYGDDRGVRRRAEELVRRDIYEFPPGANDETMTDVLTTVVLWLPRHQSRGRPRCDLRAILQLMPSAWPSRS